MCCCTQFGDYVPPASLYSKVLAECDTTRRGMATKIAGLKLGVVSAL